MSTNGQVHVVLVQPIAQHHPHHRRALCASKHVRGAGRPHILTAREDGSQEPHPAPRDTWGHKEGHRVTGCVLLSVIKCMYLPPTNLHFIQDIEDRCLLLTSSTSFVDLPFQEHRMMEKHHMDQNPYISSFCLKPGVVTINMT
jgi:hypothetical protein